MKQPKRLTYEQKLIVSGHNLNPNQWMFVEELEFYIKIIHKETGVTKLIDKFSKVSGRKEKT